MLLPVGIAQSWARELCVPSDVWGRLFDCRLENLPWVEHWLLLCFWFTDVKVTGESRGAAGSGGSAPLRGQLLFLRPLLGVCVAVTLSVAHTLHVGQFLLKSSLLPFSPHPQGLSFYPLFFTLFYLGARVWRCLSNGNHSQWRARKTRVPSFLWICPLRSLCHRGKDSAPKNVGSTVMLLWAFQ